MNNSINNTTPFKANLAASAGKLKIYQINYNSDIEALVKLSESTHFDKLMPQNTSQGNERWQEMLDYAIETAGYPGNVTYAAAYNNKLCGIISYFPRPTTVIDCICTIPTEVGKKVKLAGKTLFLQVFKDFMEYRGSRINLSAITDGPYNTVEKYKSLGFIETSEVTPTYVKMTANQHKIKETLGELSKIIPYKKEKPEKVNLNMLI